MLLDALFNPERPPNPQYRDKYIWILAYAVSVVDVGMYAAIDDDVASTSRAATNHTAG
jgi:hypothetical protein